MPMYFVGIDISKYKHDCCIISAADQQIISKFTITNDKDGFEQLLTALNCELQAWADAMDEDWCP